MKIKTKHMIPVIFKEKYSEEVIYFSKEIDVRANWDVDQVLMLALPYIPEIKIQKATY
jgi:hypothetical protein